MGILVAAALAAGVAAAPRGAAAAPDNLRQGLFGRAPADGRTSPPPVARYVAQDGQRFVLDRSNANRPLLKYDGGHEVWVLQPQLAPRGDVIYKNDLGEPVLRATRLGGLTLFTETRPGGVAAAADGGAPPVRLASLTPQALLERLAQASARASRAARRLIPFEADVTPSSASLVADAAMVTAEALAREAERPEPSPGFERVRKVSMAQGPRPGAVVQADVLVITVAPEMGLAGRPSSDKILAAVR